MSQPIQPSDSPPSTLGIVGIPPAHEALRYWFNDKRGRRTGLARLLGLSAATVASWGRLDVPNRPHEPFYLFAVQEIVGIPVHAWLTQAELAALEPVLQNFQPIVYSPAHRRSRNDPRQLCFDDALARLATEPAGFDPDDAPSLPEEDASMTDPELDDLNEEGHDPPPFDVDAAL